MKRLKQLVFSLLLMMILFIISSCGKGRNEDIVIVYTNDMHSYIANEDKVVDEEINKALRINNIKAYVDSLKKKGSRVLLVDAGDHVQGSAYGAIDKGSSIINIMNAAGYDLSTVGNHEFDYGMSEFNKNVQNAEFDYISCNFKKNGERVLDATKVFKVGNTKVAFVGVSTPQTVKSSTPTFFQNENGEFIYTFDGDKDCNDLYNSFQDAVDSVTYEADYVIGLGHLGVGVDAEEAHVTSKDLIENTNGIDAFIDGHSHTRIDGSAIKNKDNCDVLLTQTGAYNAAFGVMRIKKDGTITTELKSSYELSDNKVSVVESELIRRVSEELGTTIATTDVKFYINNSKNPSQRLIRARETNLGDLTADAYYWYFNEYINLECDISLINGGGIRAELDCGDITYFSAKNIQPYGNIVCLMGAKGSDIIDALELSAKVVGDWDDVWNCPAENGGFLHAAGLKFVIDSSVTSDIHQDETGSFVSQNHKIKDVMVYNKQKGEYEPIDPDKLYTVSGINYILGNGGNGMTMFDKKNVIADYVGEDYMVFAEYLKAFKDGSLSTQNSPLSSYNNYLLDYENPFGSGRIDIINAGYEI